jgi:hypothetical protein
MAARTSWTPPVGTAWADALSTDFGPHFQQPLQKWFQAFLDSAILTVVGLRARVAWDKSPLWEWDVERFADELFARDDQRVVLAIDAALYELAGKSAPAGRALSAILEAGGSAWRVRDDGRGLERRVPEAVRTAVVNAISSAEAASADAARHLRAAWGKAYGIAPDAKGAYAEAVCAVESAASRLVEPRNANATLGTVNGVLRADPAHWQMAITDRQGTPLDVAPTLAMMELLWRGQTDRHGANPSIPVTLPAAQAAVHLAATLVQWWTSGAVVKV